MLYGSCSYSVDVDDDSQHVQEGKVMLYVLIVVTNAYNGVTISQQEYKGQQACEVAAIVIQKAAKDVTPRWMNNTNVQTRCVVK